MRIRTALLPLAVLLMAEHEAFAFVPINGALLKVRGCGVTPRQQDYCAAPQQASEGEETEGKGKGKCHGEPSSDSAARRQILFSMLATAAGAPLIGFPNYAAAATTIDASTDASTDDDTTTKYPTSSTNIMKPPLDDRDYEYLTLSNGLRVMLCSDPTSNEAAAAMDVHVGACSDPDTIPGLAHFQEHMLFLGTKDYPKEDSFEAFLSANGGSSNAYTDSENTVYFFNMETAADNNINNKLGDGLLRFGSFFTNPLFTEAATGRELNAIDSENAKNLQSDVFRSFQISKSRASPQHPFSKFFTGNKRTLLDETKKQGIDLRKELIAFNQKYYSANQMTLAIVAPQTLAQLKRMVQDAFGNVPNRHTAKPELAWSTIPPFQEDSLIPSYQHVVEIVPVQDLRQLTLSWALAARSARETQEALLNKQDDYVSHLIGHEGPGSLYSYLKKKNWVNSFSSSTNNELSNLETFDVTVGLTSQGLANVDSVAECVFSYVSMLREQPIPNYIFDEVLQLAELQWRFLTKGQASNYATSLSTALQKFDDPDLVVAGPRRLALSTVQTNVPRAAFSSPEEELLTRRLTNELVNQLTVDNVMVTVMSKTFAGKTNRKEKWYGTAYRARPIPQGTLNRWRNPMAVRDLGVSYPKPNPFIPTEAGLRVKIAPPITNRLEARTFDDRIKPIAPPHIIRDDDLQGRWTVYYKADDRFGQPKAFVIFQLLTKEAYSSPDRAAMAMLYQQCAIDRLDEYAYDAMLAGLTFDVNVLPRGVRLTFGGYNDKLQEFAAYVVQNLAKNTKKILPKSDLEFANYKDDLMRGLSAFDVKQPYAHASYFAYLNLQPRNFQYTNAQLREAVRKATLPDLQAYTKTLWSSGKGEALVQGNLSEKEALKLVSTIDKTLGFKTIQPDEYPLRMMALPLPCEVPTRLTIAEPNASNENSAVHLMLQSLGRSEKDHVLIEILEAIVSEPFFAELRTKQQLGYIVSSGVRALEETRTIAFVVQSSVQPVQKLTYEILDFLDTFEVKLANLSEGDFAVYVKGLIDRKTEPDKQLASETTRNWNEITTGRFQFDRIQREVAALLELNKQDLITFWRTIYSLDQRRVLVTEIVPREGAASSGEPVPSMGYAAGRSTIKEGGALQLGIDDIQPFRKNREQL